MVKTAARGKRWEEIKGVSLPLSLFPSFLATMITKERLSEELGEQGFRTGGSIRLPPIWPGFKSRRRSHMLVEFVVGSLFVPRGFSLRFSRFPLSSKTSTSKFQSDLKRMETFRRVHKNS